jgi:hypothetical protein
MWISVATYVKCQQTLGHRHELHYYSVAVYLEFADNIPVIDH